jgi:hypothetical protein
VNMRIAKKIATMQYGTHVYSAATRAKARRRYLRRWLRQRRAANLEAGDTAAAASILVSLAARRR